MPLPSPSPILIDIDSLTFFCCKFGRSVTMLKLWKKRPAKKTSILNVQNSKHLDPISWSLKSFRYLTSRQFKPEIFPVPENYWLLMAEIWRSPVEVGSLSHYLQGFIHPRWCRISAINSMTGWKMDHHEWKSRRISYWKMVDLPAIVIPSFVGRSGRWIWTPESKPPLSRFMSIFGIGSEIDPLRGETYPPVN